MEYKDYYKVLGLEKNASATEIKKTFRKLARQHHPDVNPKDNKAAEHFREINEAYEVLGDVEKRKKYDEYGSHYKEYEQWVKAGGEKTGVPFEAYMNPQRRSTATANARGSGSSYAYPGGGNSPYTTANPEDLQDLFGNESPYSDFFYDLFGGDNAGVGRGTPGPRKGRDVEAEVHISLEEAFVGAKRALELADEPGKTRRLEVSIPAGVDNGSRVRLAGLGESGRNGGPKGDLYLNVTIEPHPFFERKGADLNAKINAPLQTAILGGEVAVPTITGKRLALKIAPYTQNGKIVRLRGQGMPRITGKSDGERGDLLVQINVQLPMDLTTQEREALESFAQLRQQREVGAVSSQTKIDKQEGVA